MPRRADRLFQIAELLRGRRLTTAQQLAQWMSVSLRTVYRDVRDLQLSGVPIEGRPASATAWTARPACRRSR